MMEAHTFTIVFTVDGDRANAAAVREQAEEDLGQLTLRVIPNFRMEISEIRETQSRGPWDARPTVR